MVSASEMQEWLEELGYSGFWVYRMYAYDGILLYVGCSTNVRTRLMQHYRDTGWANMASRVVEEGPFERFVALRKESLAIVQEKPRYNQVGVSNAQQVYSRVKEFGRLLNERSR